MSQRATRWSGYLLFVAGVVTLAAGVWNMQERLGNREVDTVFFQDPMHLEAFRFTGELVRMELVQAGDAEPPVLGDLGEQPAGDLQPDATSDDRPRLPEVTDETWLIRYHFRGEHVDFPIFDDADARLLPAATDDDRLALVDEWFGVYPMVTGAATAREAAERTGQGDLNARLVIAARYEPGNIKRGWSSVQRQNWIYRIAELQLNAEPVIEVVEKTYRELDAIGTPGKYTPEEMIPTEAERSRDLWMHYVMQQVTPAPFYRAKDRRLDSALEAMGWTWPVSLGGGFAIVLSIVLVGLGFKSRELPT